MSQVHQFELEVERGITYKWEFSKCSVDDFIVGLCEHVAGLPPDFFYGYGFVVIERMKGGIRIHLFIKNEEGFFLPARHGAEIPHDCVRPKTVAGLFKLAAFKKVLVAYWEGDTDWEIYLKRDKWDNAWFEYGEKRMENPIEADDLVDNIDYYTEEIGDILKKGYVPYAKKMMREGKEDKEDVFVFHENDLAVLLADKVEASLKEQWEENERDNDSDVCPDYEDTRKQLVSLQSKAVKRREELEKALEEGDNREFPTVMKFALSPVEKPKSGCLGMITIIGLPIMGMAYFLFQ